MKIKIEKPKKLVNYAFINRWEHDLEYIGETEIGYEYQISKVNNLKLESAQFLIHKETQEIYDPYGKAFQIMVNFTYTSNKGKVVNNRVKIETVRSVSALLESMWKTMRAVI